jgi:hypothetical protein
VLNVCHLVLITPFSGRHYTYAPLHRGENWDKERWRKFPKSAQLEMLEVDVDPDNLAQVHLTLQKMTPTGWGLTWGGHCSNADIINHFTHSVAYLSSQTIYYFSTFILLGKLV